MKFWSWLLGKESKPDKYDALLSLEQRITNLEAQVRALETGVSVAIRDADRLIAGLMKGLADVQKVREDTKDKSAPVPRNKGKAVPVRGRSKGSVQEQK